MKNKLIIILLITVVSLCGCNIIQDDREVRISVEDLKSKGYVTYKEEEIIDGIKEIYQGMVTDVLTSFACTMEKIKETMPIENVREYSDGYIIEYPMENRMFVIVTDKNGRRKVSFMRSYEERTEKDINKLKNEMSVEDVKKIFPEIEVNHLEGEVILNNNEIVRLLFEEKEKEKVFKGIEYITYFFGESEFEEIMNIEETLIPKNTLLVIDNVLVKGETQLYEVINNKENEILKIKYTNGVDETDTYEDTLQYKNGKYILKDFQHNTKHTFNYIVKLKGESLVTGYKEEGFFLTNDKEVTYEEAIQEILISSSVESMDCRKLFLIN